MTEVPTEAVAPEATSPVEPTNESALDTDLPQGDTFERAYVEKLRKEAASHRVRAKDYEQFFEPYGGRESLEGFLSQFQSRQGVLEFWAQIAQELGIPIERLLEQEPSSDDPDAPLTKREWMAHQQQQQQQQQQWYRQQEAQGEDQEVRQTLRELNVPKEAERFVAAAALSESAHLGYAERLRRGLDAYNKLLDSHVSSVKQAEESNRAKTPAPSGGGPAGPAEERKDPTGDPWKNFRRRARARLEASERANTLND